MRPLVKTVQAATAALPVLGKRSGTTPRQPGGCPARVRPQPVVRAEGHRGVLAYSRALFAGYGIAVETTATCLDGDETSEPASSDLYPVAAAKITAITPANVALRA